LIPGFSGFEGKRLRRRAWEAVLSILLSRAVRIGEQFILVPCFLSAWGIETYGEWLTVTAVVAFVSFTNVGLAAASASDIVMSMGAGNRQRAEESFSNCVIMLLGIGAVVLVVLTGIFLGVNISAVAGFESIRNPQAVTIVACVAASLILGFFNGPLGAIIGASVGVSAVNLILALAKTLEIATIVSGLLLFKIEPATAAIISLIWACVVAVSQIGVIRHVAPSFRLRPSRIKFDSLLTMVRPSLSYFLLFLSTNIVGIEIPRLIIFSTLGPAAVAIFSVTLTYSRTVRSLAGIVTSAMQVELGRLFGSGDIQRFRSLVVRLCRVTIWSAVSLGLLLLAGAALLIPLWTNGRIAVEWPLLSLLILGASLGSLADAITLSLTSINRVGRVAIASLGGVVIGLALGGLLTRYIGTPAIAAGLLVPELAVVLLGRIEIAKSAGASITFAGIMRWPGDLLRVEYAAAMRFLSGKSEPGA